MTRADLSCYRCDKCGEGVAMKLGGKPQNWGALALQSYGDAPVVSLSRVLCPDCMNAALDAVMTIVPADPKEPE